MENRFICEPATKQDALEKFSARRTCGGTSAKRAGAASREFTIESRARYQGVRANRETKQGSGATSAGLGILVHKWPMKHREADLSNFAALQASYLCGATVFPTIQPSGAWSRIDFLQTEWSSGEWRKE
jgi:hypothetical protein